MGRQPCCERVGLKRGPWTMEEDSKLINFILNNGIQCWRLVPKLAGLMRCGKSCRLRWINYLRPDLKRGAFTEAEEDMIIQLHARLGNRWSKIAAHFPGRTDNEIKNHWNTRIKKRMKLLGLDPLTHQPIKQNLATGESEEITSTHQYQQLASIPTPPADEILICESNQDRPGEVGSSTMFQEKEPLGSSLVDLISHSWMENSFIWDGFSTDLGEGFP